MIIADWINAELARNGLRLAEDDEEAWWEPSSAGLVLATDDVAETEDLVSYAKAWNRTAYISRSRMILPATPPVARPVVTPQIVYDIWRDGCAGPARVATLIQSLTAPERIALEIGYWRLLRQRHTPIPLVEVRRAFDLVLIWNAAILPPMVVEGK